MLGVLASPGLLGVIRTAFGLRRLARETEGRNTSWSTGALRKQAGPSLDTAVEFALDFLWTVEPLEMLHVDMTQPDVIEEKLLLRGGEILVSVGEDFHIEDLHEMVGRARRTGAVRTT
jgi:hypothetical protein